MNSICSFGEVLDVFDLNKLLGEFERIRDIALGIVKYLVAQLVTAHDIAGNGALKELEVTADYRSHLLHALFGHFAHVGGDFELWCRAHSALRSAEPGFPEWPLNWGEYSRFSAFSQGARDARTATR